MYSSPPGETNRLPYPVRDDAAVPKIIDPHYLLAVFQLLLESGLDVFERVDALEGVVEDPPYLVPAESCSLSFSRRMIFELNNKAVKTPRAVPYCGP
jgi:hypothetical protein